MFSIDLMAEAGGYLLTTAGFLFLAILLLTSYRERLRSLFLAAASVATALWAGLYAAGLFGLPLNAFHIFLMEFLLDLVWLVFLATLMGLGVGGKQFTTLRLLGIVAGIGILMVGSGAQFAFQSGVLSFGAERILVMGQIAMSLIVLINVEQIIRNARAQQRRGLKYLCLSVGAIFAFDLVLYTHAILVGQISAALWSARGYVVVMTLPLIVIAANRTPTWSGGLFVSRQVVFHTATVFAAGGYLTFIGLAGEYIREFGGTWGSIAQIVFVAAAILLLCVFLFSERFRLNLRVFISKHFYRNKYDYRQEWLRLTETMTSVDESLPLRKRAIKAFADVVRSPKGFLWLRTIDGSDYVRVAGWNIENKEALMPSDASLPTFMRSSGWIVDLQEYREDSTRYEGLKLGDATLLDNARFVIPLISDFELIGFVVLSDTTANTKLNYEDRDMLKTAGRQVASYLAQDAATELLAQGRQFEAFNKLTAYLMHDLKNVIAQQSLIVQNAPKHKHKPEFIDDVVSTLDGGVARMRRVIEQLKQSSAQTNHKKVDLVAVVQEAVAQCNDRQPAPKLEAREAKAWVRADKDRLLMAICHAIGNSQDATATDGSIVVRLLKVDAGYTIDIEDDGCGMDETFIRERLFRPFDSTKGTQGMGIGAYQLRETVLGAGGRVDVRSRLGQGTTITLSMPAAS